MKGRLAYSPSKRRVWGAIVLFTGACHASGFCNIPLSTRSTSDEAVKRLNAPCRLYGIGKMYPSSDIPVEMPRDLLNPFDPPFWKSRKRVQVSTEFDELLSACGPERLDFVTALSFLDAEPIIGSAKKRQQGVRSAKSLRERRAAANFTTPADRTHLDHPSGRSNLKPVDFSDREAREKARMLIAQSPASDLIPIDEDIAPDLSWPLKEKLLDIRGSQIFTNGGMCVEEFRIYNKTTLLANLEYYLQNDDFKCVYKLLAKNPLILSKEEAQRILHNAISQNYIPVVALSANHSHIMDDDTNRAFVAEGVPFAVDNGPLEAFPRQPIPPNSRKFVAGAGRTFEPTHHFAIEEKAAREFAKRYKQLYDGLWHHGALMSPKERRRFVNAKADTRPVPPRIVLAPPRVYSQDEKEKIDQKFEEALQSNDLMSCCQILRRHARLVEMTMERLRRFVELYKNIPLAAAPHEDIFPRRVTKFEWWKNMQSARRRRENAEEIDGQDVAAVDAHGGASGFTADKTDKLDKAIEKKKKRAPSWPPVEPTPDERVRSRLRQEVAITLKRPNCVVKLMEPFASESIDVAWERVQRKRLAYQELEITRELFQLFDDISLCIEHPPIAAADTQCDTATSEIPSEIQGTPPIVAEEQLSGEGVDVPVVSGPLVWARLKKSRHLPVQAFGACPEAFAAVLDLLNARLKSEHSSQEDSEGIRQAGEASFASSSTTEQLSGEQGLSAPYTARDRKRKRATTLSAWRSILEILREAYNGTLPCPDDLHDPSSPLFKKAVDPALIVPDHIGRKRNQLPILPGRHIIGLTQRRYFDARTLQRHGFAVLGRNTNASQPLDSIRRVPLTHWQGPPVGVSKYRWRRIQSRLKDVERALARCDPLRPHDNTYIVTNPRSTLESDHWAMLSLLKKMKHEEETGHLPHALPTPLRTAIATRKDISIRAPFWARRLMRRKRRKGYIPEPVRGM